MTPGIEPSLQEEILRSCFTLCAWLMSGSEASSVWTKQACFYVTEVHNKICMSTYNKHVTEGRVTVDVEVFFANSESLTLNLTILL